MPHPEAGAPLARLLGLAQQQIARALQERLREAGLPHRPAYNNVFAHIPPEGIRLTELADRAAMTKQAMAELVTELEGLGYLKRSPDATDGRAKVIEFTDRGWISVRTTLDAFADIERDLEERLGKAAVTRLRTTLTRIIDA